MDELSRFTRAQDDERAGIAVALQELRAGRKRSHWIWYVFPQLAELGSSEMARHFGVRGRHEAEAYLGDDVLGQRLVDAIESVADHMCGRTPPRLEDLMGSRVDALKLVSSLTLFESIATDVQDRESPSTIARIAAQAGRILAVAKAQGYPRCALTLDLLRDPG
jgi:uncharacterized protein (DUF1810 family)